jgi:hypothetical protein
MPNTMIHSSTNLVVFGQAESISPEVGKGTIPSGQYVALSNSQSDPGGIYNLLVRGVTIIHRSIVSLPFLPKKQSSNRNCRWSRAILKNSWKKLQVDDYVMVVAFVS